MCFRVLSCNYGHVLVTSLVRQNLNSVQTLQLLQVLSDYFSCGVAGPKVGFSILQ